MNGAGDDLRAALEGPEGFFTGLRLAPVALDCIKSHIERQWLERLRVAAPELADPFEQLGIARYHELAERLDHATLWPKTARILPPAAVEAIRAMAAFQDLERRLGPFEISREENVGWDEITWRLVRPGQPSDIGPLHADAWFWELGHGVTPAGRERIKLWGAVVTEAGLNGLRVVPGSHRRSWRHDGEWRDGKRKPRLREREEDLTIELIRTTPGDVVVFHDRLLHGGAVNHGALTRVSFEMTLFVSPEKRWD